VAVVLGEDKGDSDSDGDFIAAIMPSCVLGNGSFSEGEEEAEEWNCWWWVPFFLFLFFFPLRYPSGCQQFLFEFSFTLLSYACDPPLFAYCKFSLFLYNLILIHLGYWWSSFACLWFHSFIHCDLIWFSLFMIFLFFLLLFSCCFLLSPCSIF